MLDYPINYPKFEFSEDEYYTYAYSDDLGIHLESYTPTSSELRERAYRNDAIIEWEGKMLTIDDANKVWLEYAAEGSNRAQEIQALIITAKRAIRDKYPDTKSDNQ